jgi:hypothetical protein
VSELAATRVLAARSDVPLARTCRMSRWLLILGAPVALAAALYICHRVLLWMDRRQWIFYRGIRRGFRASKNAASGGGAMAGVLSSFQQLVEPEIRYVMEEQDQRKAAEVDEAAGDTR